MHRQLCLYLTYIIPEILKVPYVPLSDVFLFKFSLELPPKACCVVFCLININEPLLLADFYLSASWPGQPQVIDRNLPRRQAWAGHAGVITEGKGLSSCDITTLPDDSFKGTVLKYRLRAFHCRLRALILHCYST